MKRIVFEHVAGFSVVVLAACLVVVTARMGDEERIDSPVEDWQIIDSVDVRDPMQFALLRETMAVYYADEPERIRSMTRAIEDSLRRRAAQLEQSAVAGERGLSTEHVGRLGRAYLAFVLVYVVSMVIVVILARCGAVLKYLGGHSRRTYGFRFSTAVRRALTGPRSWKAVVHAGWLLLEGIVRTLGTLVLFSPAYVVAYAVKSGVETANLAFMAALAVMTNGVLIGLTNTFYMILIHERRKGYVETARVKGLFDIASSDRTWSETIEATLWPMSKGRGDIFQHVYANARLHSLPAIKRYASLMVTGLIIIEMALNVQGHLCYELMQSVLFGDTERVVAIVVGMYAVVKSTELLVDVWHERELSRFRNGSLE